MFLLFALAFVVASCAKDTNPKRFDKMVVNGTWRIAKATFNNQTKTALFNNNSFKFSEGDELIVTSPTDTIITSWSRGNEKSPLMLYLHFSSSDTNYLKLDNDWVVTYLTKDEFHIKGYDDNPKDEVIFRKKL